MRIDWWTLALQTVNVLLLVWLLSHFLFKPVSEIIAKRRDAARKLIDDAKRAQADAQAARDAARAEADAFAAARADRLRDVQAQIADERARLLAAARDDAQRLRDAATAQRDADAAERERDDARRASRLAVDIARRLVARLPENARVAGFVDGLAAALAGLPGEVRDALAADGAPLRLLVPRELTEDEARACRAALAEALGRAVEAEVRVDPEVIAGIELESKYASIRNSFRQDLARIEAALLSEDDHDRADPAAH